MTVYRQPSAPTMFSGGLADIAAEPPEPAEEVPVVPSREVTTEAGRYLQAAAREDSPPRIGPAGSVDHAAVRLWEIAFGLAVRRRFLPDAPLAELSRTVSAAVHDHSAAALPLLDAEMLTRHALGEPVPVDEIDPVLRNAVHLLVFASLADEMALGDAELDDLIAEAEELAAAAT